MTITRNDVEGVMLDRLGLLMTELGLDGVNTDNPDLNDPIGYAIRQCGGTVTSISLVSDADLANIPDVPADKLFDFAELRLMETLLAAARRLVSISVGPRSEQLGEIAGGLVADIQQKRSNLEKEHGLGISTLQGDVISLRFAETND
jgi:hypothetical protein